MKEYQVINILEGIYEECVRDNDKDYMERNTALTEAVKALTEIQYYRAIGTVEECREARERQDFTEDDFSQIRFALDYLHNADLSNYGEESIKALESVMRKLNMDFIDWSE